MLLVASRAASAGPETVGFPDGYTTAFVRYATVDKPERTPPIVRFFYVNREALAEAKAGQPLPYGTVIVMEDHRAELDAAGRPATSAAGDLVPTAEITNVFVQQKGAGWGAQYPAETRNGEWEYGWFLADGSPKADAKFDRCFACHKDVEAQDYNYTLSPFVAEIKGRGGR
jgi:hypothetical protein